MNFKDEMMIHCADAASRNGSYDNKDMIYVCSRFTGNEEANMAAARRYCRYVMAMSKQPVAAHLLYPRFMNDCDERERAMEFALRLLLNCGEIWVFGDGFVSEGMQLEIMTASRCRIPILFRQEEFEEWAATLPPLGSEVPA